MERLCPCLDSFSKYNMITLFYVGSFVLMMHKKDGSFILFSLHISFSALHLLAFLFVKCSDHS